MIPRKNLESFSAYALLKLPTTREQVRFHCKDSEPLFFGASAQWTLDVTRAVCFISPEAAVMFLRRLPVARQEGVRVTHVSGSSRVRQLVGPLAG